MRADLNYRRYNFFANQSVAFPLQRLEELTRRHLSFGETSAETKPSGCQDVVNGLPFSARDRHSGNVILHVPGVCALLASVEQDKQKTALSRAKVTHELSKEIRLMGERVGVIYEKMACPRKYAAKHNCDHAFVVVKKCAN
jgi:hypothetical protein